MAGVNTLEFTSDNFETEVLQADQPVLVDFWAEWCSPCLALTPIIDQLADEYAGRVKVGKVNVDHNNELSGRYGVSSIPTVMLFLNGEPQERLVGLKGKKEFASVLDRVVSD